MSSPSDDLNFRGEADARDALTRCCGASRWVEAMLEARPFAGDEALFETAERLWWSLEPEDWREAFAHHPRIGERRLEQARFAKTASWSKGEQAGTAKAPQEVLDALHRGNIAYEERFGHVFLICATGLGAEEMLASLESRLDNDSEAEVRIAAGEQAKITRLRLRKLVSKEDS